MNFNSLHPEGGGSIARTSPGDSVSRRSGDWYRSEEEYHRMDGNRDNLRSRRKRRKEKSFSNKDIVRNIDRLVSFREYVDIREEDYGHILPVDGEEEDMELIRCYKEYKRLYVNRSIELFFQHHKDDDWFSRKFHPILSRKYIENNIRQSHRHQKAFKKLYEADGMVEFSLDPLFDASNPLKDPSVKTINSLLPRCYVIVIKLVPPFVSHSKLEFCIKDALDKNTEEELRCKGFDLIISDPFPHKKFYSMGWIIFDELAFNGSALDSGEKDSSHKDFHEKFIKCQLSLLNGVCVDGFDLHFWITDISFQDREDNAQYNSTGINEELSVNRNNEHDSCSQSHPMSENILRSYPKIRVLSEECFSNKIRIHYDYLRIVRLAKKFDEYKGYDHIFRHTESPKEKDLKQEMKDFDTLNLYMRVVHSFCYYCGDLWGSLFDVFKNCGHLHVRKQAVDFSYHIDDSILDLDESELRDFLVKHGMQEIEVDNKIDKWLEVPLVVSQKYLDKEVIMPVFNESNSIVSAFLSKQDSASVVDGSENHMDFYNKEDEEYVAFMTEESLFSKIIMLLCQKHVVSQYESGEHSPGRNEDNRSECSACLKVFKAPHYVLKHLILKHQDSIVNPLINESIVFYRFLALEGHIWSSYVLDNPYRHSMSRVNRIGSNPHNRKGGSRRYSTDRSHHRKLHYEDETIFRRSHGEYDGERHNRRYEHRTHHPYPKRRLQSYRDLDAPDSYNHVKFGPDH